MFADIEVPTIQPKVIAGLKVPTILWPRMIANLEVPTIWPQALAFWTLCQDKKLKPIKYWHG